MSKFKLPRGWYRSTAEASIRDLEDSLGPLTRKNAWLFLYACVAWFEKPKKSNDLHLHVNDRLNTESGKKTSRQVEAYIQSRLPTKKGLRELSDQIGRAYDNERKKQGSETEWQRNNVTGNALEATLQVIIERLTGRLPSRTPILNTLQGFELAPVGYHSRPDLVLFSPRDFRLLISTKWTLRKERIGTYLHEAYFYKRRRPDLQVAFVVSEFSANILQWLVDDPLVDRVYHVCLPALLEAHQPFPDEKTVPVSFLMDHAKNRKYATWMHLSSKLRDLEQLFEDIDMLGRTYAAPDPEEEDSEDVANE